MTAFALLVDKDDDYDLPEIYGPFATVREGQEFARQLREDRDIPGHENVEPTGAENEAWSDLGWYFGIQEMRNDKPTLVGDTYAGTLYASVSIGLDETDEPVNTTHDLARLLLRVHDGPLDHARIEWPENYVVEESG